MSDKMYYFVILETREGNNRWTKFSYESELADFLNKSQDDEEIALIKYISKQPETYLEAVRSRNNDDEKVQQWTVAVANKTCEKLKKLVAEHNKIK